MTTIRVPEDGSLMIAPAVRNQKVLPQVTERGAKHTRIIVTRYGGPDAMQVVEEERPEPKHDEVRVCVLAAGVSLPDVMMREGIHPEAEKIKPLVAKRFPLAEARAAHELLGAGGVRGKIVLVANET